MKNTCQICGRVIKATTGLIAHHGYQRPYKAGWQSGSCRGARGLPYEVSCDLLPPAIAHLKVWLTERKAHLADFVKNPPATITIHGRYQRDEIVREKPEGFDPEKGGGHPYLSYESEWHSTHYQIKIAITGGERDLEFMEKRLADWKPVSGVGVDN